MVLRAGTPVLHENHTHSTGRLERKSRVHGLKLRLPALLPACLPQIAPTRLRGTLGSINQLLICVGILAALLVNVALPASAWRAMFGFSALPAVLLGLGAWRAAWGWLQLGRRQRSLRMLMPGWLLGGWMGWHDDDYPEASAPSSAPSHAGMLSSPESPVWLVLSGQRRAAEETAQRLWGPEGVLQLGGGERCCGPCVCDTALPPEQLGTLLLMTLEEARSGSGRISFQAWHSLTPRAPRRQDRGREQGRRGVGRGPAQPVHRPGRGALCAAAVFGDQRDRLLLQLSLPGRSLLFYLPPSGLATVFLSFAFAAGEMS